MYCKAADVIDLTAFFTTNKVGAVGLSDVTVDVYERDVDGVVTQTVTADPADPIGGGAYGYRYTVIADCSLVAIFKTSDPNVDFENIPATGLTLPEGAAASDVAAAVATYDGGSGTFYDLTFQTNAALQAGNDLFIQGIPPVLFKPSEGSAIYRVDLYHSNIAGDDMTIDEFTNTTCVNGETAIAIGCSVFVDGVKSTDTYLFANSTATTNLVFSNESAFDDNDYYGYRTAERGSSDISPRYDSAYFYIKIDSTDVNNSISLWVKMQSNGATSERVFTIPILPEIEQAVDGGSGATPEDFVAELLENMKLFDSIKMSQGTGAVVVDTTLDDYDQYRVTDGGGHGVKNVVVRVFPYSGESVNWNALTARHVTNAAGNWRVYLDAGRYVISYERNGVQLKTDDLVVGQPTDVWPPLNAIFVAAPDLFPDTDWKIWDDGTNSLLSRRIENPFGEGDVFMGLNNDGYMTENGVPVRTSVKMNHMYEVVFEYGSEHTMGHGYDEFEFRLGEIEPSGKPDWSKSYINLSDFSSATMGAGFFTHRALICPETLNQGVTYTKLLEFWDRENGELEFNGILFVDLDDDDGVFKRLSLAPVETYVPQPMFGFAAIDGDPGVGGTWENNHITVTSPLILIEPGPFNGIQPEEGDEALYTMTYIYVKGSLDGYLMPFNGGQYQSAWFSTADGYTVFQFLLPIGQGLVIEGPAVIYNWEDGQYYPPAEPPVIGAALTFVPIKPE